MHEQIKMPYFPSHQTTNTTQPPYNCFSSLSLTQYGDGVKVYSGCVLCRNGVFGKWEGERKKKVQKLRYDSWLLKERCETVVKDVRT
jgi:hypothetical protein